MKLVKEALNEITAHIEQTYPYEGCGVMLGVDDKVMTIYKGTNIRQDRKEDRFLLDPSDINEAEKLARQKSMDVLGFYHSHPDHPAMPSSTDLEDAWEGYYYLIASVNHGEIGDVGLFKLSDAKKDFIKELIKIEE